MTEDILFFFDREPQALSLFELLCEQAMARWPSSALRVQKTQITFPIRGDICSPPSPGGAAAA